MIAPVIVPVLPPCDVTTPPIAMVFVWLPVGALKATATGMVIVHDPFAGIEPPVNVRSVAGSDDVSVEPQVPAATEPVGTV